MAFPSDLGIPAKLAALVLLPVAAAGVPLAVAVLDPKILWPATGGAVALVLLVGLIIAKDIAGAAGRLERSAARLAEGRIDGWPAVARRADGFGRAEADLARTAQALVSLHGALHHLVRDGEGEAVAATGPGGAHGGMAVLVAQAAASFGRIGEQAAQVAVAAGQASTAVSQVADGASMQNEDLDRLAGAIGQSAKAIATVADDARVASDMVKDAAGFAEKGRAEMARLERVAQTVGDNSRRIGRITEAITQIAVKTNILSVNASIEAARAGEQGKGFEVVAEEVGKLADSAVESARQIAEIVEAAATMAEEGMSATAEVGRMMEDIALRVAQLDRTFQSVASAMEQQQSTIVEVSSNIGNIRTIASKNAAASEEITATMLQLSRLAEETRRQAARFRAG